MAEFNYDPGTDPEILFDADCEPSELNGTYLLDADDLNAYLFAGVANWATVAYPDGSALCGKTVLGAAVSCTPSDDPAPIAIQFRIGVAPGYFYTTGFELVSAIYTQAEIDALLDAGSFEIDLVNVERDGDPGPPADDYNIALGTGKLRFFGSPGCQSCTTTPPTAGVTITRQWPDADFNLVDLCSLDPSAFETSCTVTLADDSTPGDVACPIVEAWLFVNGSAGIEVPLTGDLLALLFDGCGLFEDTEAVYLVIDECGCVDTTTIDISCCGCCTPSGGFSINLDDNVDGIDASNCDQPTDLAPDPCCSWGHQWCYYTLHFGDVEVGECSAGGLYIVDWGCVQARDGGAPPECVYPGDDVRVRIDAGCYGECCCIGVTVVNYEGCAAETTYHDDLIDNAFCMARDEYDALDPEVFGDCYPLLIPYDCPPP